MTFASHIVRAALSVIMLANTPSAEAADTAACAKRELVVKKLEQGYGEILRSMGLQKSQGIVEIYSSETTGSWTILMTRPDGVSCLIAAGQLWEQDVTPIDKPGDPA